MPYKIFTFRADGTIEVMVQPKAPELEQLQRAVGGFIETVPSFTKYEWQGQALSRGRAYCNEDGLSKRLAFNAEATRAWRASCPKGNPARMDLIGDVIFYAKVKP